MVVEERAKRGTGQGLGGEREREAQREREGKIVCVSVWVGG